MAFHGMIPTSIIRHDIRVPLGMTASLPPTANLPQQLL